MLDGSVQQNSLRCPVVRLPRYAVRRQELLHCSGNFGNMRLYRKMPRIQKLDPRVRYVFSKCLGACGDEKRIVLPPNGKQRRLRLPKVILKRRIKLHVRSVIEKQIQLDVFISWALEQSGVQRVRFRRNALWIAHAVRVLPARSVRRQNIFAKYLSILWSWLGPVLPDRSPGIAQSFLIGIPIL